MNTYTFLQKLVSSTALVSIFISPLALAETQSDDGLDEIVVTASPLTKATGEQNSGVSVLTDEALELRLAGNIGETLKSEPGLSSTYFGPGASRPIIRGQGGGRVRILNNGIGSIDVSDASPDHAVTGEPAQAERVEVIRGPGVLRFGSSAAGGVVNIIDGRMPDSVPESHEFFLRAGVADVDQSYDIAGAATFRLSDNVAAFLSATTRDADDFDIPGFAESAGFRAMEEDEEHHDEEGHDEEGHTDEHGEEEEIYGTVENSALEATALTAGISWVGSKGFIGVSVHSFETNYGLPVGHSHEHGHEEDHEEGHEEEHEEDADHHEEEHGEEEGITIDLEQTRFDINGALNLDGYLQKIQFFLGYADYEHIEFEGEGVGTHYFNEAWEGRIEGISADDALWQSAYGIHMRLRDFSAIGEEAFIPPSETQQLGVYSFHEWDMAEWNLEAALRYENTEQKNTTNQVDTSFDLVSLSFGADYNLADSTHIGGTLFHTQRAPTSDELFSNGPHLATNQFIIGDINLSEETATGIEAVLYHESANFDLRLNAFYTDYQDYIYDIPTGVEEDELPVFQYISADAEFSGIEAELGLGLGSFGAFELEADMVGEYVRAKTQSGDLPRIPPLSTLLGISATSDAFSFRAEWEYAASQDDISSYELPTDEYNLVNLFASWRPDMAGQDIGLNLAVYNVFDEEARQHSSYLKDQLPLPGRNIRFSITAAF